MNEETGFLATVLRDLATSTAVILAAGEGSRMKSSRPKPLHEVGGLSLLGHAMASAASLDGARSTVVVGAGGEQVGAAAKALDPDAAIAVQTERRGTAHAVLAARGALGDADEAVVLYADTPFIRGETLADMAAARAAGADVVVLGFRAAVPGGYGRLVMDGDRLAKIVEANFDYEALDLETRTSWDLWVYQYERLREAAAFRRGNYIFTQMLGPQASVPQFLIRFHRVDDASDMAAYITGADFRVDGGIHNGAGSFVFQPGEPRNIKTYNGFHRDERARLLDR